MRFRKRPIEIEAVLWDGTNHDELRAFVGEDALDFVFVDVPEIVTLEGRMMVSKGDWVIRGTRNEFYPCKPGPFEDTFEPAD